MKYYSLLIFILLTSLVSCGGDSGERESTEESVEVRVHGEDNEVTVTTLQYSDFNHELISNGKLSAKRMAGLRFEAAEPIAKIYVKSSIKYEREYLRSLHHVHTSRLGIPR